MALNGTQNNNNVLKMLVMTIFRASEFCTCFFPDMIRYMPSSRYALYYPGAAGLDAMSAAALAGYDTGSTRIGGQSIVALNNGNNELMIFILLLAEIIGITL